MNRNKLLANGIAFLVVAGLMALAFYLGGCAVLSGKSAPVNKTITEVIADAGTAAITAEQMYQTGTIAQTASNRNLINDLGASYNAADTAWKTVLQTQAMYNSAVNAQLASCTPAANPSACSIATSNAKTAKVASDTAANNLNQQISVLVTKTGAVKALVPATK